MSARDPSSSADAATPKSAAPMRQIEFPRMLFTPPQAPGLPLAFRTVRDWKAGAHLIEGEWL